MYNLIVGAMAIDGSLSADRILEVRDNEVDYFVRPDGTPDKDRLASLPTLMMPETGDSSSEQVAVVGNLVDIRPSRNDWRFRFVRDEAIPLIPTSRVRTAARSLGIGDWDFTRTRWLVKNVDLYRALISEEMISIAIPTVFKLPVDAPDPNLVSVMMPFDRDFDRVFRTIRSAAIEGQWLCQRVDTIWESSVIIEDVVSLIARSSVVVCDFTTRNANVFYETGIAHTLGRPVIPITQSGDDVPFDLKQHRYLQYGTTDVGLGQLQHRLFERLLALMPS